MAKQIVPQTPLDNMYEVDSTSLVPVIESVSRTGPVYEENPNFEADEIFYPQLRLAQGQTPEVIDGSARPGQFVLSGFDSVSDLVLVPLFVSRTRALQQGEGDNRQTLCRSDDGKIGVGAPGGECAICPMALWGLPQGGSRNGSPPPCTLSYGYVCWSQTHSSLVEYRLKRTGAQVAKMLNTLFNARKSGNFAIQLSSTSQKGGKGVYYIPQIKLVNVDSELLETARAMKAASLSSDEIADVED